jgi:hypothetical protein
MRWLTSTPIEALRTGAEAAIERRPREGHHHPIESPLDELPDPRPASDGRDDDRCAPDGSHASGAGAGDRDGVEDEGRVPRLWRVDRV